MARLERLPTESATSMERYLKRLQSKKEKELQEAISVDAAELGRRAEEEKRKLKAIHDDALVKLEKLDLKQREKQEREREWLAQKERRIKDRLQRSKEEAYRKHMEEIQRKTRKYYNLDHLWRKKETGVVYFGDHKDVRDSWYAHGQGKLLKNVNEVVYEGTFCRGMFHGNGKYTFENGDKYMGPFRRDKMHGCGVIEFKSDGSMKECIYQDHKRICFTEELLQGTRIRVHRYKAPRVEVGTIIGPLAKQGHFRVRLDEGNIVPLDLGDTPFTIAHDLPPVHLLDLHVGDTFAQKRYDYDEDVAAAGRGEVNRSDHLENFFRHDDEWMHRLRLARRKALEKAEREERRKVEEERKRIEAQRQAEEKEKETLEEAMKMHREKTAADKAAKEAEEKSIQDAVSEAKAKVQARRSVVG